MGSIFPGLVLVIEDRVLGIHSSPLGIDPERRLAGYSR